MELHEALKQIAIISGVDILSDSKLIKRLDNFDAFESIPYSMSIISTLISEGYIKKLIECRTKGIDPQQLLDKFEEKTIFNIVAVERVWNCFIFALDEYTKHQASNLSQETKANTNNVFSNQPQMKETTSAQDSIEDTFDLSYLFMLEWYDFISMLSENESIIRHTNNLNGVSINTYEIFKGDANTNSFRGKMFFLALTDVYRCLEKIGERFDDITPPSFPLALMLTKVFAQVEISSLEMMLAAKSSYKSMISMLGKMIKQAPVPERFFLIGHLIYDYNDNQTLYHQYLKLVSNLLSIVNSASYGDPLSDKVKQVGISVLKLELLSKRINLN